MATTRIDSLADRIKAWELQAAPMPKHPNRYTAPAVQLKKRLDILGARLRYDSVKSSTYHSPWYVSPDDARSMIVDDYDKMLTDIYQHLSYLNSLDLYTRLVTNNRWYYSRKKQQTYLYLESVYTSTPNLLFTMWEQAWDWFFSNPHVRKPLNTTLFYYLISLQDDEKERRSYTSC